MTVPESLSRELKNLSTALKRLDQRLQSEPTSDPVMLIEFRQSLDNVRLTAWSVSELINAQRTKNDPTRCWHSSRLNASAGWVSWYEIFAVIWTGMSLLPRTLA